MRAYVLGWQNLRFLSLINAINTRFGDAKKGKKRRRRRGD
jgi:hypothetical protein